MTNIMQTISNELDQSDNASFASDNHEIETSSVSSSEQSVKLLDPINEDEDDTICNVSTRSLGVSNYLEPDQENDTSHRKASSFKAVRKTNGVAQLKRNIRYKYQEDVLKEFKNISHENEIQPFDKSLKNKIEIKQRLKKVLSINTKVKRGLGVILEADCEDSAVPQHLKKIKSNQIPQQNKIN